MPSMQRIRVVWKAVERLGHGNVSTLLRSRTQNLEITYNMHEQTCLNFLALRYCDQNFPVGVFFLTPVV